MQGADRRREISAFEQRLKEALDMARERQERASQQLQIAKAQSGDLGVRPSVRAYQSARQEYSSAFQEYGDALRRFWDYMRGKIPDE